MHLRRHGPSAATFLVILGFALGVGGLAFAATRPEPTPALTKGTVPDAAIRSNGSVDMSKMPELISVTDHAGKVVGYAYAADIFKTSRSIAEKPALLEGILEVWDSTGKKMVGHMYPNGAGFYSLDQQARQGYSTQNMPPTSMKPEILTGPAK